MLLKLQVVEPDPELIDVAYRPRVCPQAHTVISSVIVVSTEA